MSQSQSRADDECSQLLPDGPCRLCWTTGLQADHLDEIYESTEVVVVVLFAREILDPNRDGRVRFLLTTTWK